MMMTRSPLRRVLLRLRHGGLRWLWWALRDRIAPLHPDLLPQARAALAAKSGLEIGGPSRIFGHRGALPVYAWADRLDNVNFAAETAWECGLRDGSPFPFHAHKRPGVQRIREATHLNGLADESFDFVVSSHCLEHLANPLGALQEWHRVTRTGGCLVVILPDPTRTFDHRRSVTTLDHLRMDRARGTSEEDRTHFAEVLALHDLALDPEAGDPTAFRIRVNNNAVQRCVHHHVFDEALLIAALHETGWAPLAVETFAPIHIGALARKAAP
jgi:SAM-dependent methyltransferase